MSLWERTMMRREEFAILIDRLFDLIITRLKHEILEAITNGNLTLKFYVRIDEYERITNLLIYTPFSNNIQNSEVIKAILTYKLKNDEEFNSITSLEVKKSNGLYSHVIFVLWDISKNISV